MEDHRVLIILFLQSTEKQEMTLLLLVEITPQELTYIQVTGMIALMPQLLLILLIQIQKDRLLEEAEVMILQLVMIIIICFMEMEIMILSMVGMVIISFTEMQEMTPQLVVAAMTFSTVEAMTISSMQGEAMMLYMVATILQKEMMAVQILLFSQGLQTTIKFLVQQTLPLDMSTTFKI